MTPRCLSIISSDVTWYVSPRCVYSAPCVTSYLRAAALLLRVSVHVTFQLVLATEGTWAHVARVRPLARVRAHVPLQVSGAGERRRTVVALKRQTGQCYTEYKHRTGQRYTNAGQDSAKQHQTVQR